MKGPLTMFTRFHVATSEPITRAGGLHNYVLSLAAGQARLGLRAVIGHEVTSGGGFNTAGDDIAFAPSNLTRDDSIHLHFAQSARLIRPALTGTRARLIFHFHGPWAAEGRVQGDSRLKQAAKRLLERSEYRRYGTFIVASDAFGEVLARDYGVRSGQITTVYPGVDTVRFSPVDRKEARLRLGVDVDRPTISCVRRLEPRMGLLNALELAARLPDVQLLIAGTGSMERELRSRVEELRLADRVHLLGRVPDKQLPDVFRAGDVTLVPTLALEGFGLIVLESMACGTPVISTRVGGLPEAMGPFADIYSVNLASDVDAMVDLYYAVTEQGARLAEEVRNYALTKSLEEMARAVERVVQRADNDQ